MLAIIIPNLNGKKLLEACLDSIFKQTFRDFKVYVVDNGSADGSVEMVRRKYPQANLIWLKNNAGFARANNIGIRKALEEEREDPLEFICPLNNDIEIDPDYLKELVRAARRYRKEGIKLGVLAAKLLFKNSPDRINTVGTVIQIDGSGMERGFREKDAGQYQKPEEVFGSCGAAALYTVEMLRDVAYKNKDKKDCFFDGDFFAYYEDLDLNYRSRLLGYRAFYVPRAFGYHVHSATGKSFSPFKSFHVHRNQYYVLLKNFPFPYLIRGLLFMPFRYIMLVMSFLSGKGPSAQLKLKSKAKRESLVRIVFSSWKDIMKNLRSLLQKRKEIQGRRKVALSEFGGWFRKYRASFRKMIFE